MTTPLPWALVRSRGLVAQGVFLLATVAGALLASTGLDGVPMLDNRSVLRLAWSSCLPGLVVAGFLAPPGEAESRFPSRPLGWWRLAWVMALFLIPLAVFAAAVDLSDPWVWPWMARNHALFLGLSLCCSAWLPPSAAWAPGTFYLLLCSFIGTQDAAATPAIWALPNHPPDSVLAGAFAVALLAMGSAIQVRRPARI